MALLSGVRMAYPGYSPTGYPPFPGFPSAGQESSFPLPGQYPYPSGFPPMGGGAYPPVPSSSYLGARVYSVSGSYPAPGGYPGAPQPGGAPSYPGGELWVMEFLIIWSCYSTFSFSLLSSLFLLVLYEVRVDLSLLSTLNSKDIAGKIGG